MQLLNILYTFLLSGFISAHSSGQVSHLVARAHNKQQKGTNDLGVLVKRRRGRGQDDPAGHIRRGRGQDDPAGHIRQGRGQDDPAGHIRQGRGQDDIVLTKRRQRKGRKEGGN